MRIFHGIVFSPVNASPISDDGKIVTGLHLAGLSYFYFIVRFWHRSTDAAVQSLVLEIHDWVGIIDGRYKQSLGIGRGRWIHHFQPGGMHKPGFITLAVKRSGTYTSTCRHADDHI